MDMLRWPQIIPLPDLHATERGEAVDKPAARFIVMMETNGKDPKQRDEVAHPRYAYDETAEFLPGTIYREDVLIPYDHRNNPVYVADAIHRAWGRIKIKALFNSGAFPEPMK
jgi:hypothetical protein